MLRRVLGGLFMILAVGSAGGCGDDVIPADPAVAPFVGTWDATVLTMTSATQVFDILASASGSFVIVVEDSGLYTATITVFGQPGVEIGQLTVLNGSSLTLAPSFPAGRPVATADYVFQTDDYLVMDGPTEFDVNRDGISEPAEVHFELQRQQ